MKNSSGSVQFASICQPRRVAVTKDFQTSRNPLPRVRDWSKPATARKARAVIAISPSLPADRQAPGAPGASLQRPERPAGEGEEDDGHEDEDQRLDLRRRRADRVRAAGEGELAHG